MNLELFIAEKIHFSKEGDREVTPPAVRIAMIGIALGLAVMILSVAIVIGFKKEVRNKVIGFGSHIQITNFDSNSSYESQPIAVSDTLLNALDAFPGIRHVEKFATKLGILKTDQDFQGIVLKGVDTDYDWTFFKDNLKEGEIFTIQPDKNSTDVIYFQVFVRSARTKGRGFFPDLFCARRWCVPVSSRSRGFMRRVSLIMTRCS